MHNLLDLIRTGPPNIHILVRTDTFFSLSSVGLTEGLVKIVSKRSLDFSDSLAVTFLISLFLSTEDEVINDDDIFGLVFEFQAKRCLI